MVKSGSLSITMLSERKIKIKDVQLIASCAVTGIKIAAVKLADNFTITNFSSF